MARGIANSEGWDMDVFCMGRIKYLRNAVNVASGDEPAAELGQDDGAAPD